MLKGRWVGLAVFLEVFLFPLFAQQPITFQYFYDDLNQLVRVIDSTGVSIQYVYDAVGNITQILRTTIAPAALSIFNAIPEITQTGGMLTIQGQGFSSTPSEDVVTIGSVTVSVLSASNTSLVLGVPANGMSGPISVTVGGSTVLSTFNEVVQPVPGVNSVTPQSTLANTTIQNVTVTGFNLTGSSFFLIPFIQELTVAATFISADGTSATLMISIPPSVNGRFAVVATNSAGSSTMLATKTNHLSIVANPNADSDGDGLLDGLEVTLGTDPFELDTDGDGFSDGIEVASGSDPLNPNSTPLAGSVAGEVASVTWSAANTAAAGSSTFEVDSVTFSSLNSMGLGLQNFESDSVTFSSQNTGSRNITKQKGSGVRHASVGELSAAVSELDSDGDGLTDDVENRIGTNPYHVDTDGDGYPDGLEVALGSDPVDSTSIPDIRPPAFVYPLMPVLTDEANDRNSGRTNHPRKGENNVATSHVSETPDVELASQNNRARH